MKYVFYHITDVHYFSKKNYDCDPWSLPQWNDQVSFRESEEIFKKALEIIKSDKDTNTVIFTGDMTHHGDEPSHREMIDILNDFEKCGGRVFAFTDSHDYPDEMGVFRVDKDGKPAPKEHMKKEDVLPLYAPFGVNKAVSVYKDGFSYVAEIFPGLKYIALSYEHKGRGPELTDKYMDWIKSEADKAQKNGDFVFCGIHPPFLSPSPVYNILGKGNVVADCEKRGGELAEMGIPLVLAGHSHIQSIEYVASSNGKPFYDVTTSSLIGAPPKMRKIIIDTEKNTAEIKTILMDVPDLNLGMPLADYCRKGFLGSLESIPYNMEHNVDEFIETGGGVNLPKESLKKHKKAVQKIGHFLNNLTFSKLGNWTRSETKLKKADYADIASEKVVPYIFDIIGNLYNGNARVSPGSAKFSITMGAVAVLDSIIKLLPIDLNKLLGVHKLKDIVEPLVYNNGIDDDNAVLDLTRPPQKNKPLPEFKSNKGILLLIILVLIFIVFLPIWIIAGLVFGIKIAVSKLKRKRIGRNS